MNSETGSNPAARALLCLGGTVGILAVVALQIYFAITAAVRTPGLTEHFLFALHAVPFAYYVFRGVRGTRGPMVLNLLVHAPWLPSLWAFVSDGNFGIPIIMVASFGIFMLINDRCLASPELKTK